MKETDYVSRINVVKKWLETAIAILESSDYEFAFNNVSTALIELQSIHKKMAGLRVE